MRRRKLTPRGPVTTGRKTPRNPVVRDSDGIDRMTFGHWIDLDPRYAGRFDRLQCGPTNGWIAVQADVLQGLTEAWGADPPGCYAWLREQQPVNEVGYSILLYHVPAAP